jgi:hypothetical protein
MYAASKLKRLLTSGRNDTGVRRTVGSPNFILKTGLKR